MNKVVARMCIVTRKKCDRKQLFRVVKVNDEIIIDDNYSIQGRGTYISKDKDIIILGKKKNSLSKGLKCNVPSEVYDQLLLKL